jgi:hypothetical protein
MMAAMSFIQAMAASGHPVELRPERVRETARLQLEMAKSDDDLRVLWGWASVISEAGEPVVDRQGDVIDADTLRQAAHGFVAAGRHSLLGHDGQPVGEIVESMVFTAEAQKALGIDLGREGWWVAIHVHDDEAWAAVKAGELGALSIGGTAVREAI